MCSVVTTALVNLCRLRARLDSGISVQNCCINLLLSLCRIGMFVGMVVLETNDRLNLVDSVVITVVPSDILTACVGIIRVAPKHRLAQHCMLELRLCITYMLLGLFVNISWLLYRAMWLIELPMTGPLIMLSRMVPTSVRLRTVLEPTMRIVKLKLLTL